MNGTQWEVIGEGQDHMIASFEHILSEAKLLAEYYTDADQHDEPLQVEVRAGKMFIGDQLFAREVEA